MYSIKGGNYDYWRIIGFFIFLALNNGSTNSYTWNVNEYQYALTGESDSAHLDEIEEKDGSIKGSSIKKILTRFRKNTGQAVYAVDFYGKITKYNSIKECAEGTKVPYQHQHHAYNGILSYIHWS